MISTEKQKTEAETLLKKVLTNYDTLSDNDKDFNQERVLGYITALDELRKEKGLIEMHATEIHLAIHYLRYVAAELEKSGDGPATQYRSLADSLQVSLGPIVAATEKPNV